MDKRKEAEEAIRKLALHCAETAETAEEMDALAAISDAYSRFVFCDIELRDALASAIIRFAERADCERDMHALDSVASVFENMF